MIGLLGFGLLWGVGRWFDWPRLALWLLSLLWWGALVLISAPQLGLPEVAPVVGGNFWGWLFLGPLVALIALYRRGLQGLRARAKARVAPAAAPPAAQTPTGPLSGEEQARYARHIMLAQIGGPGQKRLKEARVLVVGAGGLGAPALMYLAASGVGTLGFIDDDQVELSNLQRQIIHTTADLGMPKVFSAEKTLRAINPHLDLRPYHRRLDGDIAGLLIADYDLVLDGTDDFATRHLVNAACVAAGVPLISGAIAQWDGQVALYDPLRGGPCYACHFDRPADATIAPSCAEAGVVAPLPGVIGALMALEAIKLITGAGAGLRGQLLLVDGLYAETRRIAVAARPDCACCGPLR